jgi:hypothetical protein
VKPVSPPVVSVAVRVQLELPEAKLKPVKVATPLDVEADAVAFNVHPAEGVTRMVSGPTVVTTFPY